MAGWKSFDRCQSPDKYFDFKVFGDSRTEDVKGLDHTKPHRIARSQFLPRHRDLIGRHTHRYQLKVNSMQFSDCISLTTLCCFRIPWRTHVAFSSSRAGRTNAVTHHIISSMGLRAGTRVLNIWCQLIPADSLFSVVRFPGKGEICRMIATRNTLVCPNCSRETCAIAHMEIRTHNPVSLRMGNNF